MKKVVYSWKYSYLKPPSAILAYFLQFSRKKYYRVMMEFSLILFNKVMMSLIFALLSCRGRRLGGKRRCGWEQSFKDFCLNLAVTYKRTAESF